MKAIRTWYVGPGNVRGSRVCATDGDGARVSLQWSDELNSDGNHQAAVRALCAKRGWHGALAEGHLMKGGHDWCRVWVWVEFFMDHPKNGRKPGVMTV